MNSFIFLALTLVVYGVSVKAQAATSTTKPTTTTTRTTTRTTPTTTTTTKRAGGGGGGGGKSSTQTTTPYSDPWIKDSLNSELDDIVIGCTGSSTNPCDVETTAVTFANTKSVRCQAWAVAVKCVKDKCSKPPQDKLDKLDSYCGCASIQATATVVGIMLALVAYLKTYQ